MSAALPPIGPARVAHVYRTAPMTGPADDTLRARIEALADEVLNIAAATLYASYIEDEAKRDQVLRRLMEVYSADQPASMVSVGFGFTRRAALRRMFRREGWRVPDWLRDVR